MDSADHPAGMPLCLPLDHPAATLAVAGGKVSVDVAVAAREAYASLSLAASQTPMAVRSSATSKDLPDASFALQQDTFLNVRKCGHPEAQLRQAARATHVEPVDCPVGDCLKLLRGVVLSAAG